MYVCMTATFSNFIENENLCFFLYLHFFLTFPLCFSPGLPFSLPSLLTYHSLSLLLSTPPLLSPSLSYFFAFPLLHLPFFTFIPLHFSLPSPFHLSISLLLPLSLFFYFSSSILLHILLLLTPSFYSPSFLPSCPPFPFFNIHFSLPFPLLFVLHLLPPPFLSLPVFSFSLSNSISFFLIPILLL